MADYSSTNLRDILKKTEKLKSSLKEYLQKFDNFDINWMILTLSDMYGFMTLKQCSPLLKLNTLFTLKIFLDTGNYMLIDFIQIFFIKYLEDIAMFQMHQRQMENRGDKYFIIVQGYSQTIQSIEKYGYNYVKIAEEIIKFMAGIKPYRRFKNKNLIQSSKWAISAKNIRSQKIQLTYYKANTFDQLKKKYQSSLLLITEKISSYNDFFTREMQSILQNNLRSPSLIQTEQILKYGDIQAVTAVIKVCVLALQKSESFIIKMNALKKLNFLMIHGDIKTYMVMNNDEIILKIAKRILEISKSRSLNRGKDIYPEIKDQSKYKQQFYIQFLNCMNIWSKCYQNGIIKTKKKSRIKVIFDKLYNKLEFPELKNKQKIYNNFRQYKKIKQQYNKIILKQQQFQQQIDNENIFENQKKQQQQFIPKIELKFSSGMDQSALNQCLLDSYQLIKQLSQERKFQQNINQLSKFIKLNQQSLEQSIVSNEVFDKMMQQFLELNTKFTTICHEAQKYKSRKITYQVFLDQVVKQFPQLISNFIIKPPQVHKKGNNIDESQVNLNMNVNMIQKKNQIKNTFKINVTPSSNDLQFGTRQIQDLEQERKQLQRQRKQREQDQKSKQYQRQHPQFKKKLQNQIKRQQDSQIEKIKQQKKQSQINIQQEIQDNKISSRINSEEFRQTKIIPINKQDILNQLQNDKIVSCDLNPLDQSFHDSDSNINKQQISTFKQCFIIDQYYLKNQQKNNLFWMGIQSTDLIKPIKNNSKNGWKSDIFRENITINELLLQNNKKMQNQIQNLENEKNSKIFQLQKQIQILKKNNINIQQKLTNQSVELKPYLYSQDNNNYNKNSLKQQYYNDQKQLNKISSNKKKQLYKYNKINKLHQIIFQPLGQLIKMIQYKHYFEKFGNQKIKKNLLKNKYLLFQNQFIQIGVMSRKHNKYPNLLLITLYITPEQDLQNLKIQLKPLSQLEIEIKPSYYAFIKAKKQQKIIFKIEIKQIPYQLPNIQLQYIINNKIQKIQLILPCPFYKFFNIRQVKQDYLNNLFQNYKEQIIRGQQVPYSKRILQYFKSLNNYFPNITQLNHGQRNIQGQVVYGGQALYDKLEIPIKICIKPNEFLYIQAINRNKRIYTEQKSIQFYIGTMTYLLMKNIPS